MVNNNKVSGVNAAQVLAIWGCILLVAQLFTWIGFFSHGPVSVDPEGPYQPATYWGARFFEVLGWGTLLGLAPIVIRRCLQERRLTFDAKFCIAGLLTYWCDPMVEFIQPIFFNTAYYVNVRDWTGFIPFIINPDAGRILEPYMLLIPMYAAGFLTYAMMLNALMRRVHARYPAVTMPTLFLLAFTVGCLIEIIMEVIWLRLELISYPGAPDFLAIYVGDLKMPWIEWFTGGMVFGTFSLVRYYVDHQGLRITERGLDAFPAWLRGLISTLAMMAILNSLLITASLMDAFVGLYSAPWRLQPAHLLVGACDVPGGATGSRYGPCPGSPDYRVPLKGSLVGQNPHGRN